MDTVIKAVESGGSKLCHAHQNASVSLADDIVIDNIKDIRLHTCQFEGIIKNLAFKFFSGLICDIDDELDPFLVVKPKIEESSSSEEPEESSSSYVELSSSDQASSSSGKPPVID